MVQLPASAGSGGSGGGGESGGGSKSGGGGGGTDDEASDGMSDEMRPLVGLLAVTVACCCSGFAGVYLVKVSEN